MVTDKNERFGCDQEPVFDKDFHVVNMPFHSCTTNDGHTITHVIVLDENDDICLREYNNGSLVHCSHFPTYESYAEWLEYENRLHRAFCDWMIERLKNKAKIVDINIK